MISDKKIQEIKIRMETLGIAEGDLEENFILGSGRGGQNLQKTHSTVQLIHRPSSLQVRCSKSRQREENRWLARRLLCDKIVEKQNPSESPRLKKGEKIRKQKRKAKKRSIAKHSPSSPQGE